MSGGVPDELRETIINEMQNLEVVRRRAMTLLVVLIFAGIMGAVILSALNILPYQVISGIIVGSVLVPTIVIIVYMLIVTNKVNTIIATSLKKYGYTTLDNMCRILCKNHRYFDSFCKNNKIVLPPKPKREDVEKAFKKCMEDCMMLHLDRDYVEVVYGIPLVRSDFARKYIKKVVEALMNSS